MTYKIVRFLSFLLILPILLCNVFGERDASYLPNKPTGTAQLKIVSTVYPLHIATLNICHGINDLDIKQLNTNMSGCPHNYQITTSDRVRLNSADLLIINGAGLEVFLEKILPQLTGIKIIDCSQNLSILNDEHNEPNPHLWLSISAHIGQVSNIVSQLSKLDPLHASQYETNGEIYVAKLKKLKKELTVGLQNLKTRKIVTSHDFFSYFVREFDMDLVAVLSHDPESAPNARDMARFIKEISENKAGAILVEEQYATGTAATVARATNLPLVIIDTIVNGPLQADAYLNAMRANMATLQKALNAAQ